MDHKTNQEMNELSKKAYGSASRWRKLMDKGVLERFEREKQVVVPGVGGRLTTKKFKEYKSVTRRLTFAEVKEDMLKILAAKDGITLDVRDLPTTNQTPSIQSLPLGVPSDLISNTNGTTKTE